MSPTILKETILSTNPPDIFLVRRFSKEVKESFSEISTEQMKSCVISLQCSNQEILDHPRDDGDFVEKILRTVLKVHRTRMSMKGTARKMQIFAVNHENHF